MEAGPAEFVDFRVLTPGDKIHDTEVTQEGLVYFPSYMTGFYNGSYSAEVWAHHPSTFVKYAAESTWSYSKVVAWQDKENCLPGIVQFAPFYYMDGVGGWDNTQADGLVTITFPGYVPSDYSLSLFANGMKVVDGKAYPVIDAIFGENVAEMQMVVLKGHYQNLTAVWSQVPALIAAGSVKAQTVEANKAMGLAKDYNTNTLFGDTFIRGTENTVVFAKYMAKDATAPTYKVIKLADLLAKDVKVNSTKVLAATDAAIAEALLVVVDYEYKAPTTTPTTTTPYIVAASAPEYVVEGDKIFQIFTAVDLNNAGAPVQYKAAATTTLSITKGNIYNLTVVDGLVTAAAPETWAKGSVQAKVADLLLVKYAGASDASLVEIKGEAAKTYFATNCKIIVKNGDAYTAGNVDSLIVAKKTDSLFNDNIQYVLDGAKFTYIIVDLAK
jgi:hypothetical protein